MAYNTTPIFVAAGQNVRRSQRVYPFFYITTGKKTSYLWAQCHPSGAAWFIDGKITAYIYTY